MSAERLVKKEHEQFLAKQPTALTDEEREAIQRLAQDIPALWKAEATSAGDQQLIVRQLIERILVTVIDNTEKVQVEVHWTGGNKTKIMTSRPVARLDQMSNYPELMSRVKSLKTKGCNASDIAKTLNDEGWHPPKRRKTFNAPMVRSLLSRQGLSTGTNRQQHTIGIKREAHEWTMKELANLLQIPEPTLYSWLRKGQMKGRKIKVASRFIWLIHADDKEQEQLCQQRKSQSTWVNPINNETH